MLDAGLSPNSIGRIEPQRGGSQGILPNIAVSTNYIEDLIYNKIPQVTSSPQDPGRFARRRFDPSSENVVAQAPSQLSAPKNIKVPNQQPNIEETERVAAVQPSIVTSPRYKPLDLLLVLAPHLADPELAATVNNAYNEQAALNGVEINA